ncbi:MAG: transglutaminase-like domain-containing protein [Gammaproteobacteria bacterium]|nr:transglutaminase-like domain-containing protein [Gammaproteobacteria bacterium]MBU1601204.1 transglutaminase-like domain-containing protein [Gammaproteobacteria bacterium]MBU2434823.1 transglutaminase-like domain-containing protein [Gammaproteobacteria bacterium]MBU2450551.1 transglutaminase-like domain-containing protein [Gammaproteobacteria bacterium]
MKRRDFLASAAALSLFVSDAWAAKKQAKSKVTTGKSGKTAKKPVTRRGRQKGKVTYKPQQSVAHTADDPVIERPPLGTSASRLPPVRAPEPPSEWRTFEITTTVNLKNLSGPTKLWLPLPLNQDTLYQRTLGHSWSGNQANASMRRLPDGDLEVFYCDWPEGSDARLQLTTHVSTADRHFDVTKRTVAPEREDILRRNLQASQLIPNDGLAFQLGERILGRIKDPVAQAKAIYDWVVDNTIYDPALPGCGTGDVRRQLIQGKYGGRSADINGLFVAICRAIGIPARCVYGLRTGSSRLFSSLGLRGDDATHGQHVRAEFYVPGYSWIPVDPSDVRRAISLEILSDLDSKLISLKKILFGVWEMNWIAFNLGTDVVLPGTGTTKPFLLLPQLESSGGLPDPGFQYSIRTRQVVL